jgi:hypothetical protein
MFCAVDGIYCIFLGSLNNLCHLIKQYGLSKGTNEAMFVIEAYRTLRDRGPYPADQVLKDLDGSFGFVVYDDNAKTVFAALVIINYYSVTKIHNYSCSCVGLRLCWICVGFFEILTERVCYLVVQGGNEEIRLFWGISADGSAVISDKLEVVKASCGKSFAPFPTGM